MVLSTYMDLAKLGEKIRDLRKSRGITQKELGDFLGYSESFISYIEKGERKLSIDILQKIAKMFSVDIDFLISKPKITHFRATTNNNDTTNYTKMMDDFRNFIDKQI